MPVKYQHLNKPGLDSLTQLDLSQKIVTGLKMLRQVLASY